MAHDITKDVIGCREFEGQKVNQSGEPLKFYGSITDEEDMVTKKYVDSLIRGNVELFLTENASDIGTYFDLTVDNTGDAQEDTDKTITAGGTTLIGSWASKLNEAEIEAITDLESGIYTMHIHAAASFPIGMTIYYEFYRRTSGGVETLLGTSHDSGTLTTSVEDYELHANITEDLIWDTGDRVVVKVYGRNTNAANKNIAITYEGDTLSRVSFPAFIPPTFVATHSASHEVGGSDIVEALPIGFVFISVVADNPNTLLGYGTWSAIGAGRVLVGLDSGDADFDTIEETGGSKTQTLTEANLASHDHSNGTLAVNGTHTHAAGTYAVNGTHTHSNGTYAVNGNHYHDQFNTSVVDSSTSPLTTTNYPAFAGTNPISILGYGIGGSATVPTLGRTNNAGNNVDIDGISSAAGNNQDIDGTSTAGGDGVDIDGSTSNAGSGTAHNNVQPYLVVHMWKRTA